MKFLIIFVAIFSSTNSLILNCVFTTTGMNQLLPVYSCYGPRLSNIEENEIITEVKGNHASGKSNADVKLLYIRNHTNLSYFPRGIENFFPNLIALGFESCNISSLNGDEVEPFSKLEWFVIDRNSHLKRIPGNLFKNNPLLSSIWFSQNQISQVGENLLSSLTRLNFVSFLGNLCINEWANNSTQILPLIENLRTNCLEYDSITPSTTENPSCSDIEESICSLKSQTQLLMSKNEEINLRVNEMTAKIDELSSENKSIQIKLDAILKEILDLSARPCGL